MAVRNRSLDARTRAWCLAIGVGMLSLAATGCRVSETDVKRWEQTQRGPYKLVAVITHDKYSVELRTDASMSLIRMPARGGVRQGIKFLIEKYKDEDGLERDGALMQLSEEARRNVVDRLVPRLIEELKAPPPSRSADGRLPPDKSVPFKDAGFALLVHEPPLIANDKTKTELKAALIKWSQTGFEDRVENGSQQYGLEQMMRTLGSESVKSLPSLVNDNTARVDRIASLVKDIGDDATKLEMSKALASLADRYSSKEWLDAQTKFVKEYNGKNNVKADDAQVAVQVDKIQERRLTEEVFPSMKKIAGRPSVEWLLRYASDAGKPAERRKLALAGLEGNLDKRNTSDLERLFAIAKNNDAPDVVRDGAFRRMGEFPKDVLVPRLWTLGEPPKWKVRWVAFELVLKTMTAKQVPEFMAHLPKTPNVKMAMTEPLTYGAAIRDNMEGEPKTKLDAVMPYLSARELGPKLVALGYFWGGKKADVRFVQPLADDRTLLPKCEKEDECSWSCDVPKPGNPKETEPKELKSVGEFVKLCLIPSMDKDK